MRSLFTFKQRRRRRHVPIDIYRSGMSQYLLRDIGVGNDFSGKPMHHTDFAN